MSREVRIERRYTLTTQQITVITVGLTGSAIWVNISANFADRIDQKVISLTLVANCL